MKSISLALFALVVAAPSVAAERLIPAGSLIQCTISEPKLSSKNTAVGDPVLCQVGYSERYGRMVLPYNSFLVGRFEDYKDPGHFVGKGWMELEFDRMVIEPDTVIPVHAKVVAVPGYNVDRQGRILGKGHAVRDTVEWTIPILWPIDILNLPRRGPRPTLKSETRLTLKIMDDFGVPATEEPNRDPSGLIHRQPSAYTPRVEDQDPPTLVYPAAPPVWYAPPPVVLPPWAVPGMVAASRRTPYAGPNSLAPVTLVFKDGRPPQQVQNYMLTPARLYVLDGYRQVIPLDQIDMNATQQANRAAGIDFRAPQLAGQ